MEGTMKVAYLTALREIQMGERPIPTPGPGEVLIKIMHIGICGSDLHYYEEGRIGKNYVQFPAILGHEGSGEVVELGEGTDPALLGQLVAVEPQVPCGHCHFCHEGRYNLCPNVRFLAAPPYEGLMAEYFAFPAQWCHVLPQGLSTLQGAMAEPYSVGYHAALQADARPKQRAIILGSGCIGLCTLLALKKLGLDHVHMTDLSPMRLDMARKLGATATDSREVDKAALLEMTQGQGFDLVFETAGSPRTAADAVDLVARGGTITMVGILSADEIPYPMTTLIRKEVTLKTVFRYKHQYPTVLDSIAHGVPVTDIVTHTYPFAQTAEAFAFNADHKDKTVKIILEV